MVGGLGKGVWQPRNALLGGSAGPQLYSVGRDVWGQMGTGTASGSGQNGVWGKAVVAWGWTPITFLGAGWGTTFVIAGVRGPPSTTGSLFHELVCGAQLLPPPPHRLLVHQTEPAALQHI